jgi:hypothetical protein
MFQNDILETGNLSVYAKVRRQKVTWLGIEPCGLLTCGISSLDSRRQWCDQFSNPKKEFTNDLILEIRDMSELIKFSLCFTGNSD